MTLSLWAAWSAIAAAVFLGLRAQMLKPDMTSWPEAPGCIRWACFGLSIVLGAYAVAVLMDGHRASLAETLILAALCGYAALMWLNLYRQFRQDHADA